MPNISSPRIVIAALALSAAGFVGIALNESYTDRAVIPIPGDRATLGFGTTEGVKLGDRTTPPKALERALRDVSKDEGAVKKCVKVPLHQYEFDAYLSLAYNIGTGAFCDSTLVRKLNTMDYAGACAEIPRWNRAAGKVQPGLVNRRAREQAMCLGKS